MGPFVVPVPLATNSFSYGALSSLPSPSVCVLPSNLSGFVAYMCSIAVVERVPTTKTYTMAVFLLSLSLNCGRCTVGSH